MLQSVGGSQESILSVIALELVGFRDWPNITLHTSTHASSPHLTSLFVRDKGDLLVPKCKYRRIYEYKSTNTDAFCTDILRTHTVIYMCVVILLYALLLLFLLTLLLGRALKSPHTGSKLTAHFTGMLTRCTHTASSSSSSLCALASTAKPTQRLDVSAFVLLYQ